MLMLLNHKTLKTRSCISTKGTEWLFDKSPKQHSRIRDHSRQQGLMFKARFWRWGAAWVLCCWGPQESHRAGTFGAWDCNGVQAQATTSVPSSQSQRMMLLVVLTPGSGLKDPPVGAWGNHYAVPGIEPGLAASETSTPSTVLSLHSPKNRF